LTHHYPFETQRIGDISVVVLLDYDFERSSHRLYDSKEMGRWPH
jgi:hypothetical protein